MMLIAATCWMLVLVGQKLGLLSVFFSVSFFGLFRPSDE